jgi:hypothetical protein
MKYCDPKVFVMCAFAAGVMVSLTGCISVRRDVEPTTTTTTTVTRPSPIAPATTTTVERTTY